MIILAIESSCDETAAAVVENGTHEVCSVVASSKELHEKTGGVVPEVAARKQSEFIIPVIHETLKKFYQSEEISPHQITRGEGIDALAVTVGPGLIGSLVVGVEAAKALSFLWEKPLIPVNHLVGHIYANFVDAEKEVIFPAIALLVSGGHTDLVLMKGHMDLEYLGGTLDDAAGEAFDKTARLLGLAKYLGGVELSKKASECSSISPELNLPRPMIRENNYDFSFSGLKTAIKRIVEKNIFNTQELACDFENSIVDVLVFKTIKAAKEYKVKSILLGGGVAANKNLRSRLQMEASSLGVAFHVPPIRLCTDNAVYIGSVAYFSSQQKKKTGWEGDQDRQDRIEANPSLGIMDKF